MYLTYAIPVVAFEFMYNNDKRRFHKVKNNKT